jgi:glycogen debranching enzyme GlgX/4-alpha-glucanotransferase
VIVSEGMPERLGVVPSGDGVNVAIHSEHATAVEFCLFDADDVQTACIRLPGRTGHVFHGHVGGVAVGARYGLRAHGPFDPAAGHRFNPAKLLMDPHALEIDRVFRLHASMMPAPGDGADDVDSAPHMPKGIVTAEADVAPPGYLVPWDRTMIYELHVRGFTMRHPAVPEAQRGTFAALGHPAVVAHLVGLGVTTVEVLPGAAWIEERHLAALRLTNYWGYNPVALCAPDPRLAPGGWAEIRAAVAALAAAGIETIVDVVLNHSGEGDELGPTVSLRGLDNAGYYALRPDSPAHYINDSGCGNTLALHRPAVLRLAADSLRAWARMGGVHGFRFDLAATMGRRPEGFDPAAPLLAAIAQDPLLSRLKLIAEPWDIGPGGYQLGAFPAEWGEWNDRFRDDVRRYWRGDGGMRGALATRLAGSADVFAGKRRPSRSVNYITAHDGFTLADLVSHERKRNVANGEDNRDGTDGNYSWNNGAEGETGDVAIVAARLADQKALLALLLLSRGTPMLAMGSESGHSQGGNNNAYAQDNESSWIDWSRDEGGLSAWCSTLIALRRDHPALREDRFLTGDTSAGPMPDVTWQGADGHMLHDARWTDADKVLVVVLSGSGAPPGRLALLINPGHTAEAVLMPDPGACWEVLADSSGGFATDHAVLAPRCVVVLGEMVPGSAVARGKGQDGDLLLRLGAAAGIAADWWEVGGTRHIVGDDTRRSLLAGMGLESGTDSGVRMSLELLAGERDRRPLPLALTVREDEAAVVAMGLASGLNRRATWLVVALEDGGERRVRLGASDGRLETRAALDGRIVQTWHVTLPALPVGRHVLRREDVPGVACALAVVPGHCYLPPGVGRVFGVSAQLYSLRREGDQGIGDFSTLAELARATAGQGGTLVGLNPLHALFGAERERASPYQPSDRSFLDPIYLDMDALPGLAAPRTKALLASHASAFAALSARKLVAYPELWGLKRQVLESLFDEVPHDPAFEAFIAGGGEKLRRFAAFEAISEAHLPPWQSWPEALRDPAGRAVAEYAATPRARFHMFLQYLSETALARAAAAGRDAGLRHGFLRDLAVGAAPDGAEAWANAGLLAPGASIGSPPDPFSAQGQVWGLPPPNPLAMARDGYRSFAGLLAANMRHAGALRIDHAMGLARLFWVPDGAPGAAGAYVATNFADLLGQVALESRRAGCMVIGEDLGTVPEGFRDTLCEADMLGFRVLLLERQGIGFKPTETYPSSSLACVSTHDLPTLAGWWQGADIAERETLGQIDAGGAQAAREERSGERAALDLALHLPNSGAETLPAEVAAGAHAHIAASAAALVLVQAEDLAGETTGVNLPGTNRERPNWQRRLRPEVATLMEGDPAAAILAAIRAERG